MNNRRPVLSVTFKLGEQNYSVISVWPGKFAGTYNVSRDKGSEKYPPMSIIDVLKSFARGEGFINVRVNSEAEGGSRSSGGYGGDQRQESGGASAYDDGFGGDDLPF